MSRSIVSWGETLWDLYEHERLLGGCAANVALHLIQLGCDAHLVTRVGDDELGHAAIEELAARGLSPRTIQIDANAPTGCVEVRLEGGEPRFSIAKQAAWDSIELNGALRAVLEPANALVFGTLAQRTPLGFTSLQQAAKTARARFRVCDLNIRQPWASREAIEQSIELANVVKLNAREAETLRQLYGVQDVAAWLLTRSVDLVALTLDARGSELHTAEGCLHVPAFPVPVPAGPCRSRGRLHRRAHGTPRRRQLARARWPRRRSVRGSGRWMPRRQPSNPRGDPRRHAPRVTPRNDLGDAVGQSTEVTRPRR